MNVNPPQVGPVRDPGVIRIPLRYTIVCNTPYQMTEEKNKYSFKTDIKNITCGLACGVVVVCLASCHDGKIAYCYVWIKKSYPLTLDAA